MGFLFSLGEGGGGGVGAAGEGVRLFFVVTGIAKRGFKPRNESFSV
jgi:hypothetical protein